MNHKFMDTQSLLRTLAGSVEKLLEEGDILHASKFDREILEGCHFWKQMGH